MTEKKKVFVLGAGFTKAFVPDAPLMVDYYCEEIRALLIDYEKRPHAKRILEQSINKRTDGKIDIEELMTRLAGSMPYDFEQGAEKEVELLLLDVKRKFLERIEDAKKSLTHKEVLELLARYCVHNKVDCITFNYDDVFDEALWEVNPPKKENAMRDYQKYWDPSDGYGFFCRPAESTIATSGFYAKKSSILLLKLHGSINWFALLGHSKPYSFNDVVQDADWYRYPEIPPYEVELISKHIEQLPFIVPPVLNKSDLAEQPILKRVWTDAHKILTNAQEITFVGYSLPITDIAARFLFTEAIQPSAKITVVNHPEDDGTKEKLKAEYKGVFHSIDDSQFDFRDARIWAHELPPGH